MGDMPREGTFLWSFNVETLQPLLGSLSTTLEAHLWQFEKTALDKGEKSGVVLPG